MKSENNIKNKVWVCDYVSGDAVTDRTIKEISEYLNISEICATLLYNRGHKTPQLAASFLKNEYSQFYDPYLLKDMDKELAALLIKKKK